MTSGTGVNQAKLGGGGRRRGAGAHGIKHGVGEHRAEMMVGTGTSNQPPPGAVGNEQGILRHKVQLRTSARRDKQGTSGDKSRLGETPEINERSAGGHKVKQGTAAGKVNRGPGENKVGEEQTEAKSRHRDTTWMEFSGYTFCTYESVSYSHKGGFCSLFKKWRQGTASKATSKSWRIVSKSHPGISGCWECSDVGHPACQCGSREWGTFEASAQPIPASAFLPRQPVPAGIWPHPVRGSDVSR
jgi:hypothetical protein